MKAVRGKLGLLLTAGILLYAGYYFFVRSPPSEGAKKMVELFYAEYADLTLNYLYYFEGVSLGHKKVVVYLDFGRGNPFRSNLDDWSEGEIETVLKAVLRSECPPLTEGLWGHLKPDEKIVLNTPKAEVICDNPHAD